MTERMDRRQALAIMLGALGLGLSGCVDGAAGRRDAAEGGLRTIGFDLWAGVSGVAFGAALEVTRGSRRIHGPLAWRHPVSGARLQVYELLNREENGVKRQLYALNHDGGALGRVFDSRPGRNDRVFLDDAFFPLGEWSGGEARSFPMQEFEQGEARARVATLQIRRISHVYRGVDGSLTYDWTLTDPAGRKLYDERFIHSPGRGFVKFINRLA